MITAFELGLALLNNTIGSNLLVLHILDKNCSRWDKSKEVRITLSILRHLTRPIHELHSVNIEGQLGCLMLELKNINANL